MHYNRLFTGSKKTSLKGKEMKITSILTILVLPMLIWASTVNAESSRSDGLGGFNHSDGSYSRSDGLGGFNHSDGSYSRSDGLGGFNHSDGSSSRSDGLGGYNHSY